MALLTGVSVLLYNIVAGLETAVLRRFGADAAGSGHTA